MRELQMKVLLLVLLTAGATANVPSWSPDGRMLAFVSNSNLE